mgnify:CR=1 FL=1
MKKKYRKASRAILVTPEKKVLLMKYESPDGRWCGWITPGGGLAASETHTQALCRELKEELNLSVKDAGEPVLTLTHEFQYENALVVQHDTFFYITVDEFVINRLHQPESFESQCITEIRWFSIKELQSCDDLLVPSNIVDYIEK